jgi:hypothetical protein
MHPHKRAHPNQSRAREAAKPSASNSAGRISGPASWI